MSAANRRTHSASRIGWNERRRGMVAACLLLGVVVLSGCSLAPQHQTPSLPVSSAYPADTGMLAGATSVGPIAAEITWHEYFVDPYLRTLIARRWRTVAICVARYCVSKKHVRRMGSSGPISFRQLPPVSMAVGRASRPISALPDVRESVASIKLAWVSQPGSWTSGGGYAISRTQHWRTIWLPTRRAGPLR